MPIHVPGHRDRNNKSKGAGKRSAVAILSLTAMVDMFTVLAVFLLQNYATTGQIIEIAENVELPSAGSVKELKPSNVVIISSKEVLFNNEKVGDYSEIKEQEGWDLPKLDELVKKMIEEGEEEKRSLTNKIKKAVNQKDEDEDGIDEFRKLTIQADRNIEFLTIKKIMFTATNSGIYEINFAVLKTEDLEAINKVKNQ